ncbi:MAG: trypsin-like peptidase domain-containing protein [Anaerolineae bacterium]
MKKIGRVLLALLMVFVFTGSTSLALTRDERRSIMKSSVLILAMNVKNGKVADIAWSGSGTIIDKKGLILTNYHVVEETGDWNALGILITSRSDKQPEPSYLAQIVAKNPDADLAVLQIVSDFKGKAVDPSKLNLVPVPIGNADDLELGDEVTIFGYPGIGSGTITLTEGKISGFLTDENFDYQRAWLKTDAAISGGNSGGTAVDETGALVGIPTRGSMVDVRRIADTNEDGIIDEQDAAVPTGGFINLLRPINMAFDLIAQAQNSSVSPWDTIPSTNPKPTSGGTLPASARFSAITFASQVDADGNPLDTATKFDAGTTELYAFCDYQGMKNGLELHYIWSIDNEVAFEKTAAWPYGQKGSFYLYLQNGSDPLPAGSYQLEIRIAGKSVQTGTATIGTTNTPGKTPAAAGSGVTISGLVYDAYTNEPIEGAGIIVLKPGITVASFLRSQKESSIASIAETDSDGYFTLAPALARGKKYGVIVIASGYTPIAQDKAFDITNDLPAELELETIELEPQ